MSAALKSSPPPPATRTEQSVALREHLIAALKADLIGPFAPPAASGEDVATELLPQRPTRWYLTGFLSPETARDSIVDASSEEEAAAGDDKPTQDANEADQGPKIKHRWPASLGLSVLLPPGTSTDTLDVRVCFAEYQALGEADEHGTPESGTREGTPAGTNPATELESGWRRVPQTPQPLRLALDADALLRGQELPDAPGLHLVGKLGGAPGRDLPLGARALSLFLVNRRRPPNPKQPDACCIFQVELELGFAAGFLARPNLQGEGAADWDDNVNDVQFRARCEYGVGHGVAVEIVGPGGSALPAAGVVTRLRTTWLPRATVPRVKTRRDRRVETHMHLLAELKTPEQVRRALEPLPLAYAEWIAGQRSKGAGLSQERADTIQALMDQAEFARERIARGIELVASDAEVRRAFCAANRAMGVAAERRSPQLYPAPARPEWHLFQLAFILLNVESIAHADDPYRDLVELIFFPTGGGKTEAYLGVIAFTLVLRRLRGEARPDRGLGVAVILRYTLRLLTLDQLSRASTLICALEQLRKADEAALGSVRFSIGLWVGRSATANTMKAVALEIKQFNHDSSPHAVSPFPLTHCPWCRSEGLAVNARAFDLKLYPDHKKSEPQRVVVSCANWQCEFSEAKDPNGLPVVFVDEQIYRELPSFIVATVDKFAMMPWRGEIGLFFGRAQACQLSPLAGGAKGQPTAVDAQFFGPMSKAPKGATRLPEGLLPPELIVQDELHLISGPLGTMVGLYETAIDQLCTHEPRSEASANLNQPRRVRPKILAATATVRRSAEQVKALYARERRLFPPPGADESETFFAELDADSPGRLYLGVAAPGRAMKAILLRSYVALLGAAQKHFDPSGAPEQSADAYMTLAGYFNSLRELGGMRRLVEDDVRARVAHAESRKPRDWQGPHPWSRNRTGWLEPVELTSREKTETIKQSKARLATRYLGAQDPVDVLLASNMISVGVDIDRLGLMVVAGQPKTTSEYIQASSRVGRHRDYPGLVVTCFNLVRPRDRSHFERFTAYHESFYRHVEASSVTPFSGPALDRGLAGTLIALLRLGQPELTPPRAAMDFGTQRAASGEAAVRILVARALEHVANKPGEEFGEQVRLRARKLLDRWEEVIADAVASGAQRTYSGYDLGSKWTTAFLHPPLEEHPPSPDAPESHFVAPTSLRDVEPTVPLWLPGSSGTGGR